MKIQFAFLFALMLISCSKGKPTLSLSTDKETVAAGEPVSISFTTSGEKKIKKVVMEAYLLKGPNRTKHYESRLYYSEDGNSTSSGQVLFVIPETTTYAQIIEPGDAYEFTLYCESGRHQVTQSKSVTIVP